MCHGKNVRGIARQKKKFRGYIEYMTKSQEYLCTLSHVPPLDIIYI